MPEYEFQWEEPPEEAFKATQPVGRWWARLSPLLERPGEWARVASGFDSSDAARRTVSHLKRRRVKYPPGRFEFVRTDDSVYARYLGEDDL